jgi:hypothetical protein
MKRGRQIFLSTVTVLMLLLCNPLINYSQTIVDVTPGFSTLNDAVTAFASTPNVVFRLQRGADAIYLLNGSITASVPLSIVATSGTGARPQLIPAVGSGGVSDIPLRAKANLTIKGVYVAAKDELGAYLSQVIRVQADGVKLVIDDCFMENTAQSAIRTDNKNAKIFIINSVIRNCASDWANGRGIDDRGVNIDTLYVENSTIHNIASRFLRDGGGYINYAYFNHNTFTNSGYKVAEIGECPKFVFKNNLIYNCGFTGKGKSSVEALLQLSPLTSSVFAGVTQTVDVRNNNFYLDPALVKLFPDTVIAFPNYNAQLTTAITASGSGGNTISEGVAFTTPPPSVNSLVTAYWADPALGSSTTTALNLRANGTYNFAYPTSAQSYTKGTANQPLGSLTWFNLTVGIKEVTQLPENYSLSQNFPNPFNPTTNIRYNLPASGMVRIDVYNSLGQCINTLVNQNQSAGVHQVTWNGKNISGRDVATGVYLYKLTAGNFTQTKKMLLVK